MKATPAQLDQDLRAGGKYPLYLLHGQEAFLIDRAAQALAPAGDDLGLEIRQAAESDPAEAAGLLAQMPMFGSRRVVLVRHLELAAPSWPERLLDLLPSRMTGRLVLTAHKKLDSRTKWFKRLEKDGLVVEFTPLREREVLAWLETEAGPKGLKLDPEAKALLLARVGQNLAHLASELEKLALFARGRGWVKAAEVRAVSAGLRGYEVFDLGQAVGDRDGLKALTILHHVLLAGEAAPAMVGLLAYRLRTLWLVKSGLDRGLDKADISSQARLSPYWLSEYLAQAKRFKTGELAEALIRLHRTDLDLKQGAPARESLEGFILWLCR